MNYQTPRADRLATSRRSKPLTFDEAIQAPLRKGKTGTENVFEAASATLVLAADGGPIRTVITGRRVIVTGFYSSRKAGRSLPFEGMNEPAMLKRCEVDTHVVDYRSQPFRFDFVIDGVKRSYIADCARILDDETIEVVEVKGSSAALADPHYLEKLDRVREICAQLGWRFTIVTKKRLFEPRIVHDNIELIQSRRQVAFEVPRGLKVLEAIERAGGQASLGHIASLLGAGPAGFAAAQSMMVRRWIAIDLERELSADSQVTAVPDRAATIEWSGRP